MRRNLAIGLVIIAETSSKTIPWTKVYIETAANKTWNNSKFKPITNHENLTYQVLRGEVVTNLPFLAVIAWGLGLLLFVGGVWEWVSRCGGGGGRMKESRRRGGYFVSFLNSTHRQCWPWGKGHTGRSSGPSNSKRGFLWAYTKKLFCKAQPNHD